MVDVDFFRSFSISSISPIICYQPYAHGDPTGGWSSVLGGMVNGDTSTGTPFHTTNATNASLNFTVWGHQIDIFGAVDGDCPHEILVDNEIPPPPDPPPGYLARYQNLEMKTHSVTLTARCNGGSLRFNSALVDAWVGPPGSVVSGITLDDTHPGLDYSDGWMNITGLRARFYNDTQTYTHRINETLTFTFSGTVLTILGSVDTNHGPYSVRIDDEPAITYWGHSPFMAVPTQLYLRAGLDSAKNYTVTVTNLSDDHFLDIDSIEIVQAIDIPPGQPSGPPNPSTPTLVPPPDEPVPERPPSTTQLNKGALAGGLVGGLSFLLLLLLALFFFLRRRRDQRRHQTLSSSSPSPITDREAPEMTENAPEAMPTPFLYSTHEGRTSQGDARSPPETVPSTRDRRVSKRQTMTSGTSHAPFVSQVSIAVDAEENLPDYSAT